MAFIKNPNDMNALFDVHNPIHDECVNALCHDLEEIVQRITEFMVFYWYWFIQEDVYNVLKIAIQAKRGNSGNDPKVGLVFSDERGKQISW